MSWIDAVAVEHERNIGGRRDQGCGGLGVECRRAIGPAWGLERLHEPKIPPLRKTLRVRRHIGSLLAYSVLLTRGRRGAAGHFLRLHARPAARPSPSHRRRPAQDQFGMLDEGRTAHHDANAAGCEDLAADHAGCARRAHPAWLVAANEKLDHIEPLALHDRRCEFAAVAGRARSTRPSRRGGRTPTASPGRTSRSRGRAARRAPAQSSARSGLGMLALRRGRRRRTRATPAAAGQSASVTSGEVAQVFAPEIAQMRGARGEQHRDRSPSSEPAADRAAGRSWTAGASAPVSDRLSQHLSRRTSRTAPAASGSRCDRRGGNGAVREHKPRNDVRARSPCQAGDQFLRRARGAARCPQQACDPPRDRRRPPQTARVPILVADVGHGRFLPMVKSGLLTQRSVNINLRLISS